MELHVPKSEVWVQLPRNVMPSKIKIVLRLHFYKMNTISIVIEPQLKAFK